MSGKVGQGARRKQKGELESASTRPQSSPILVLGTPSLLLLGLWASSTQTAHILNLGEMEMCKADSSLLGPRRKPPDAFYFHLNQIGGMQTLDVNQ